MLVVVLSEVLMVTQSYILYIDCMVSNMVLLYMYKFKAGVDMPIKFLGVLYKTTDRPPDHWNYG